MAILVEVLIVEFSRSFRIIALKSIIINKSILQVSLSGTRRVLNSVSSALIRISRGYLQIKSGKQALQGKPRHHVPSIAFALLELLGCNNHLQRLILPITNPLHINTPKISKPAFNATFQHVNINVS
jgi:hypothetical protein